MVEANEIKGVLLSFPSNIPVVSLRNMGGGQLIMTGQILNYGLFKGELNLYELVFISPNQK
ncbi:MAG: hypothetical protein QM571_05610 [Micrococcaceae bacterium]